MIKSANLQQITFFDRNSVKLCIHFTWAPTFYTTIGRKVAIVSWCAHFPWFCIIVGSLKMLLYHGGLSYHASVSLWDHLSCYPKDPQIVAYPLATLKCSQALTSWTCADFLKLKNSQGQGVIQLKKSPQKSNSFRRESISKLQPYMWIIRDATSSPVCYFSEF